MARNKDEGRSKRVELDPEAVLAGRTRPAARDLLLLIHDVNPTGRVLSTGEATRRYLLKARLQSLLIAQFGDDLTLEAADDQDIVSLRHKHLGLDACHARLSELDDAARAWVRRRLDLGDEDPGPPTLETAFRRSPSDRPPGPGTSIAELLRQAQGALEEYDFEAVRTYLSEAHARDPDDSRPVHRLLSVLVDQLALYQDALLFADALPSRHLQSEEVKHRVALSAARTGDLTRAERLLEGLDDAIGAEANRALCAAALDTGDLGKAERALSRASRAIPGHPELEELERRLAEERGRGVAALESELASAWASGEADPAIALARRILAQHPTSVLARQVVKDAAARSRADEQAAVVAGVEEAIGAGQFERARQALNRARELEIAADVLARLDENVVALEAQVRARESAAASSAALEALVQAGTTLGLERALRLYVELDAEQRREVRDRVSRIELAWLEQAGVEGRTVRSDRAIFAVLVMNQAEDALAAGDPAKAAELLRPHEDAVRELKAGRRLAERVRTAEAERSRASAEALLAEAQGAFAAGNLDLCGERAAAVPAAHLDEPGRAALLALRERLDRVRTGLRVRLEAAQALADGDLPKSRRLWQRVAETADSEISAADRRALVEVEDRLRAWVILDHRPAGHQASDAAEIGEPLMASDEPLLALSHDGSEAILVSTGARLVFIRFVHVDSGEVRRLLVLRTPAPLRDATCTVHGQSLWVIGAHWEFLELSLPDGLPRTWTSLARFAQDNEIKEDVLVVPGARVAWIRASERDGRREMRTHVVDLDEGRLLRTIEKAFIEEVLPGADPPAVVRMGMDDGCRVCGAGGPRLFDVVLPPHHHGTAAAIHPSGRGLVVVAYEEEREDDERLAVLSTGPAGLEHGRLSLPGVGQMPVRLATDLTSGLVYLSYRHRDDASGRLAILADAGGPLVVRKDVPMSGDVRFLQNASAGAVVALLPTARGACFSRLNGTPPAFDRGGRARVRVPSIARDWCMPLSSEGRRDDENLGRRLRSEFVATPPAERGAWALGWRDKLATDSAALLQLLSAVRSDIDREVEERIVATAEAVAPDDPAVRLWRVALDARAGRWSGDALLISAEGRIREHLLHMQGKLLFEAGHYEKAHAVWSAGPADGSCNLGMLAELTIALRNALEGSGATPDVSTPDLHVLIRTMLAADRRASACDYVGVRDLLDVSWIRDLVEEQSLARLAASYLDGPPPANEVERFRFASAFAAFVEQHAGAREYAPRLNLGPHTWDRKRLDQLIRRAEAWLEDLAAAGATSSRTGDLPRPPGPAG